MWGTCDLSWIKLVLGVRKWPRRPRFIVGDLTSTLTNERLTCYNVTATLGTPPAPLSGLGFPERYIHIKVYKEFEKITANTRCRDQVERGLLHDRVDTSPAGSTRSSAKSFPR